jgi:hypothetical protein
MQTSATEALAAMKARETLWREDEAQLSKMDTDERALYQTYRHTFNLTPAVAATTIAQIRSGDLPVDYIPAVA